MLKRIIKNKIKALINIQKRKLFKKNLQKKIGKLIYRKKYNAEDVVSKMKEMGMKPGDVVFIHSSMQQFYNYKGTAEELINCILKYLGPEGTLVMPAYPKNKKELKNKCHLEDYKGAYSPILFDVKSTPTGAGYLAEVFRKMDGVKRSINIQHSTCAIGKYADFLLSEHHLSTTCWDEKSPYYKLTLLNAKVFSFGLPQIHTTCVHCTESMLRTKYDYFAQLFSLEIKYNYRDENGNIGSHKMLIVNTKRISNKMKIIKKYFDKSQLHVSKLSNLQIKWVSAKYTHDLFMELADRAITMYRVPDPRASDWTPRN